MSLVKVICSNGLMVESMGYRLGGRMKPTDADEFGFEQFVQTGSHSVADGGNWHPRILTRQLVLKSYVYIKLSLYKILNC